MNEEIEEGFPADFLGFGIDQARIAQPADGGMHFRSAHSQFLPQLRIAAPGSAKTEFECDDDILWLGEHSNTLFANSE